MTGKVVLVDLAGSERLKPHRLDSDPNPLNKSLDGEPKQEEHAQLALSCSPNLQKAPPFCEALPLICVCAL